jgi:hypothetical protein
MREPTEADFAPVTDLDYGHDFSFDEAFGGDAFGGDSAITHTPDPSAEPSAE